VSVLRSGPIVPDQREPIDVLVAHPEPARRAGIRRTLERQPHVRVVAATGDGTEATTEADRLRPAVILFDDRLAAFDRIGVLARQSRLILLTGAVDADAVAVLLHLPAYGCLVHDNFEPADLLGAVDAVARGLAWLSPIAAAAVIGELRRRNRPGTEPAIAPAATEPWRRPR
jgi:DNA-binding NarL/FixJ family response regulator